MRYIHRLFSLIALFCFATNIFAVQLSSSDKGGSIFFPLYSTQKNNESALTVSNLGYDPAAVKVLFLDWNGVAVSGVNLYLPAMDSWAMAISTIDGETVISVPDSSCTAPYLFQSGSPSNTLSLPSVGQILITDMGEVTGNTKLALQIDQETSLPRDCDQVNENWGPGGTWNNEPGFEILPPQEQIKAELQIINVLEGTLVTVPGMVLNDFSDFPLHFGPTELLPDLSSVNSSDSVFENGAKSTVIASDGQVFEDDWPDPIDAISALLATRNLSSAYSAETSVGATAEWVLSFPTLRYYKEDGSRDFSAAKVSYVSIDRNTQRSPVCPPIIIELPCPPDSEFILDSGLVAIGSSEESQFGVSPFHGSDENRLVAAGLLEIGLNHNYELRLISQSGTEYFGLPVYAIGVQKYVNGYLSGKDGKPVLANYRTHIDIALDKFQLSSGSPPPAIEDWGRDIVSTALDVDVATRSATATIVLRASESPGASFEIGDLEITGVRGESGPLMYEANGGQLNIGLPSSGTNPWIKIDYRYMLHDNFDGVMSNGLTMLWPYYCGNMFPCKSDPADGLTFELSLSNVSAGQTPIFPKTIPADAPSYQVAWAIGDYKYLDLGTTDAGTKVGVWYLAGNQDAVTAGTTSLAAHFDWLEKTYGPYPFGDEVASVEAAWGPGATGGMEHHPFWHIGSGSMSTKLIHIHEAAHGWFGDGVRIACWEDFVLSEGTASYLSARAVEAVDGQSVGDQIWNQYASALQAAQQSSSNMIAWPTGCGTIDIFDYFSDIPYMKGAYFLRAVERRIGRTNLDVALARVFEQFVGKSASMEDMLKMIKDVSGYDPTTCAEDWLRSESLPADINAACP